MGSRLSQSSLLQYRVRGGFEGMRLRTGPEVLAPEGGTKSGSVEFAVKARCDTTEYLYRMRICYQRQS